MIEFLIYRKIKKMSNEELEDFYVNNAEKMSFYLKKKFVIESTKRELAKMGIEGCSVEVRKTSPGVDGVFFEEDQQITISEFVIKKESPSSVFSTIQHECTHAYQSKLEKELPNDEHSIKLEYSRSRYHEDINFCKYHFKDNRMYVCNDSYISVEGNEIADMFYHLCISEREAFLAGSTKEKEICERNGILYAKSDKVKEQVEKFKKRYNCYDLTDEEVYDMIDLAYANLIEQKNPEPKGLGNLCANIMYDLCIVTAYLSNNMDEPQVIAALLKMNKHNNLLDYGYTHVLVTEPSNNLQNDIDYYVKHLEELGNLSEAKQKDNPNLLALICIYTNGEAFQYVKDKKYLFEQVTKMPYTSVQFEEMFPEECSKYMPDGIQI